MCFGDTEKLENNGTEEIGLPLTNNGSRNGTKRLPEPLLTHHQWSPVFSPEGNFTENAQYISHKKML